MGTNHVVDIYLTGVSPSIVAANPEDTVQFSCPSGPSNSVDVGFATGATITFTGNWPFGGSASTINITNNGTSSKYSIGSTTKSGSYGYSAVAKLDGESHETFTGSIQVTTDMIVNDGDNVIKMPMPH